MAGLEHLDADVENALGNVRVPAYVIDKFGVIRWLNPAAEKIVGDVRGQQLTSVLAPEDRRRGREIFMRNLNGPPEGSENRGTVLNEDGERIEVELCAVPLTKGGHVFGVFGLVKDVVEDAPEQPHPELTPRQVEILHLLEQGRSTTQIAAQLHLSIETVRNHIRHLMQALGVHSRLEAVAVARAAYG
jgi:PAS domain S-box-containing protein